MGLLRSDTHKTDNHIFKRKLRNLFGFVDALTMRVVCLLEYIYVNGKRIHRCIEKVQNIPFMERSLGVRKGAWSNLEDDLLRACVQQYGEGKWHLVPKRAGLNRCRKSCRLRWFNYLNPKIKRGEFAEDEVDLMLRLHKLLGNRWSLIAGRFPGRTPNDVKNYWNSYIRKKEYSHHKETTNSRTKEIIMEPHVVIKPQPRTITTTSPCLRGKSIREDQSEIKQCTTNQACAASSSECNNIGQINGGKLLEDMKSNEVNNLDEHVGDDFVIEGQSWEDILVAMNCWDYTF